MLAVFVASLLTASVQAASPTTISFQARVLTKDRTQAPSGSFPFRFSLFAAATGGAAVWEESWAGGLPVRYGLFNVELGAIKALSGLDWAGQSYWLGIEFDSDHNGTYDQSFSSRIPLTAVPYAFAAKSAQTLTGILPISQGGTGATAAGSALTNLLPVQTGNSGKSLVSNGTTASWQNITGGVNDASYLTLGASSGLSNERLLQGTANQITLTDNGSNLTLSLPQDIHSTATPQFGRLGLGQAANSARLSLTVATDSAGGLDFGGDTNLYRSAGDTLKTDDSFVIGGASASLLTQGDLRFYDADSSNYVAWQAPTTASSNLIWTLPSTDSNGCLASDGSGALSWSTCTSTPSGSQYVTLATDGTLTGERVLTGTSNQITLTDNGAGSTVVISTPQDINTTSNVQFGKLGLGTATGSSVITLATATTAGGGIDLGGDTNLYRSAANTLKTDDSFIIGGTSADLLTQSDLRFYDADSSNYVGFQAPSTVGTNVNWTLPSTDGSTGQCLSTNASAVLSWATCVTGSTAPVGSQYVTLALDGDLSAERVLTGSSNQITLTDNGANGTIVLSLPQNIHTGATPTFSTLSLSATSNQLIMQSAGVTGTLTWTPTSSAKVITLPDSTGTVLLTGGTLYTAAGTSGSNQTISQGDTLTIAAGTDITTTGGATDTITIADSSTLATVTGRGATTTTAVALNGGLTSTAVNAAGAGANAIALSGTLGIFDGSDTFNGVSLAYTNVNHTGASNAFNGINVANITGDADATETALNVGTGWDYGAVLAAGGTAALNLSSTAGTAVGGLLFGTDANLYRGAANELTTDDLLAFGSTKTNTATDFKTYKADGAGGVGFIFDTGSAYSTGSLMSVRNNGTPKFSISGTGDLTIAGTLTESGSPADIAEKIAVSDPAIKSGEIVAVDTNHAETVRKATKDDEYAVGVVSTEPGILLSGATTGRALALTGRVPVRVRSDADLKIGDVVVVSDTPGLGTKAGAGRAAMVGLALTNQNSQNTVTVQLQPGVFVPDVGPIVTQSALSPQQTGVLDSITLLSDSYLHITSLAVDHLRVEGLAVLGGLQLPDHESATGVIPAGATDAFVPTAAVKETDRILITPLYDQSRLTTPNLSRGQIENGQGFRVHLDAAVTTDLRFDWLLIH